MMAKLVVGPVFELSSYFRIEFHSIVSYRERERGREIKNLRTFNEKKK